MFAVAGLINIETTVRVDGFPIYYSPALYPFHGIRTTVAGVGYNVTKALTALGDRVRLLSLAGRDPAGQLVRQALEDDGLPSADVLFQLDQTPQSAILYDGDGRRQINVDLKDIQEAVYPPEAAARALAGCSVAVLCNINFARPLLAVARGAGKTIATDVHAIADLDDDYNQDFMRAADVLFMSHERLPVAPGEWAERVVARFGNEIVVVGLGADGALLHVKRDGRTLHLPAVYTRPVVSTVGAGDALFACFLHVFALGRDPYLALRQAVRFASYKIGAAGAAEGFLSAAELDG